MIVFLRRPNGIESLHSFSERSDFHLRSITTLAFKKLQNKLTRMTGHSRRNLLVGVVDVVVVENRDQHDLVWMSWVMRRGPEATGCGSFEAQQVG